MALIDDIQATGSGVSSGTDDLLRRQAGVLRLPPPDIILPEENAEIDAWKTANPNKLISDMGSASSGSGLSNTGSSPSIHSSTPSVAPPAHDQGDIYSRLPKFQAPDINQMPDTRRIQSLTNDMDTVRQGDWSIPPPTMKGKLARAALLAAPIALSAAIGGRKGGLGAGYEAGQAAIGDQEFLKDQFQRTQQREGQLQKEIALAQSSRNTQMEQQSRAALANATMQSNALWHDAMTKSRDYATDIRANTQLDVAGSRERIAAANREAMAGLRAAQTDLARARAAGIPEQIEQASQRVAAYQKIADSLASRANTQAGSLEAQLFGTYEGNPIPGAPLLLDDQGNPTGQVEGFRPYAATGPTSATRTVLQQGGAIEQSAKSLTDFISQHKDEIGPAMGRVNNLEALLGIQSPTFNELRGRFESWIALHPKFHGFRGMQAVRQFQEAIGGYKTNPEAFISGIQGMTTGVHEAGRGMQRPAVPRYTAPSHTPPPGGGSSAGPPGW